MSSFSELVGQFCTLVERRDEVEVGRFLEEIHSLVVALYGAALALPHSDEIDAPDADAPDEFTREAWDKLYRTLREKFGGRDYYQEIFDPYDWNTAEPVTGSLADDLADIYRDVRYGYQLWDAGHRDAALWQWRFNFEFHWSEHATGALRALRSLAFGHDWSEPISPPPGA